ncbi:hypothetical protein ACIBBG_31955 [Micromonospora chersina]|uniref:hypothetical protein n=1 Tax=Micromonospora chersina TaxID=47854 RepID=UPI0037996BC0
MRTGWSLGTRTMAEMLDRYPLTGAVRDFFGPGAGLPPAAWTNAWARLCQAPRDADLLVSHKDVGVDAAAFVDAWRATGRTGRLILIPHHEPEQGEGGDPTRDQFRASWTRTREQVGDHPARLAGDLQLAVCYTLQWIRRGGDWRTWWPEHEADAVDLVLGDWYPYTPGAANPYRPPAYEDPVAALQVMVDLAAATGKHWGIAEINHSRILRANGYPVDLDPTGELCAAWYRQMHATAKRLGARVWCHYNRGDGDLTDRAPEQLALRDLIAQEATDVGAQRRLNWINDGSPFRLMTPAADLRDTLRRHGYTVYDIGNRDHLEADPPEDHTPYSATGYPGTAKYGVGYAIDIMPPKAGSGLPSLQQLGAQLLADRKAGVAGIRWLKYMNWEPQEDNGGPCYKEAWRPTYKRTTSTDRGHIHLSGLTGYENSTIAAGYDPVARIRGEDDHMDRTEFLGHFKAAILDPAIAVQLRAIPWQYVGGGIPKGMSTLGVLNELVTTSRVLASKVDIDPAELEAIRAAAGEGAAAAAEAVAAAVVAKLPVDADRMTRDQVVAAVEEGVRDAFAGGLAPDPSPQS